MQQLHKFFLLPSLKRQKPNKTKYGTGKAGNARATKIDEFTDSNFLIWKQKIDLIFTQREVDEVIDQQSPHKKRTIDHEAWVLGHKQARTIIKLSLSEEILEHVRGVNTAKQILDRIYNDFQRHTVLNKLISHRDFYTIEVSTGERNLSYINGV